ncbi:hypothetical protein EV191_101863 [Tamaricihabitans halophyticus]|uniref:Uncharacterized protein n=1 Tax=Tamaricihabitans halophyticus TaxID=1262583 RepID=A0A4R2R4R4_9PSEU|nr:hypothetical protein [Tamaricihabitans halophyticus]TCP56914.1 hypothetical protein EV191_101863 [Tamaricihabitans halophyticus]
MNRGEATDLILERLATVSGLRPAVPAIQRKSGALRWDLDSLAVDVDTELVEIRLVATELPLPPRLRAAGAEVAELLAESPYRDARIRLVVTDIDGAAITDTRRDRVL